MTHPTTYERVLTAIKFGEMGQAFIVSDSNKPGPDGLRSIDRYDGTLLDTDGTIYWPDDQNQPEWPGDLSYKHAFEPAEYLGDARHIRWHLGDLLDEGYPLIFQTAGIEYITGEGDDAEVDFVGWALVAKQIVPTVGTEGEQAS